jgi:hypothetical protein
MIHRSPAASPPVEPERLAELFQQLCTEYPHVSARAVGESLHRIQDIATRLSEPIGLHEVEKSARALLDAIEVRAVEATNRIRLAPSRGSPMLRNGDDDLPPDGPGADAVLDAFNPLHDLTAVSRFERVALAIKAQARPAGAAPTANLLCRAAKTYLDVAGAAVSVPHATLSASTVGGAGTLARRLEELQVVLGEGPSLDALAHSSAVHVADLSTPEQQARWPLYAPAAVEQGALGQYVLPMQIGAAQLGVFVLYLTHAGGLGPTALGEARIFAGIALDWLIDAAASPLAEDGVDGFAREPFVDDRPEIHQATGMISVQLGVDLATALLRLRARAFAENRLLSDLAADVVARKRSFHDDGGTA